MLTLLVSVVLYLIQETAASCGCSICSPCSVLVPCPPQIICPPQICPPPIPCPLIIPEPCEVCVEPVVNPVPIPIPRPVPEVIEHPVPTPVRVNSCCNTCITCFRKKRDITENGTKIIIDEARCNNRRLGKIIDKHMVKDLTESQITIQKMAEKELGDLYNVLCARGNLSYEAYTEDYCQRSKGKIVCYAFKAEFTS